MLSSNLRKRRPEASDKFEQPLIKPRTPRSNFVTEKQIEEIKPVIEENIDTSALDPNKHAMLMVIKKLLMQAPIVQRDLEFFAQIDFEILKSIVKRKYKVSIQPKDLEDQKKLISILNNLD